MTFSLPVGMSFPHRDITTVAHHGSVSEPNFHFSAKFGIYLDMHLNYVGLLLTYSEQVTVSHRIVQNFDTNLGY